MHGGSSAFARHASDWLVVAEQADSLRAGHEAAEATGQPRQRGGFYPRLNMSLPPDERCGATARNLHLIPPIHDFLSAELLSLCRSARCRNIHHWLASENTTVLEQQDVHAGARRQTASCGLRSWAAESHQHAALLLRGRALDATKSLEIVRGYVDTIICPLRKSGFGVDVFVTTYAALPVAVRSVLQPTAISLLPYRNSTNLLSTVASLYGLHRHVWQRREGRHYDFVVLTRLDLRLKQPINQLPLFAAPHGYTGFHFVFKEGESGWRGLNRTSPCRFFEVRKRVSDTLHAFEGSLLPCVLRGLEHYLMHEKEALHYLTWSLPNFVGWRHIKFLVPGCYDSNPTNGMLNPIYDIVPRNRKYDNSICRNLGEFKYENESDSFCCESERYCCPNSRRHCGQR